MSYDAMWPRERLLICYYFNLRQPGSRCPANGIRRLSTSGLSVLYLVLQETTTRKSLVMPRVINGLRLRFKI